MAIRAAVITDHSVSMRPLAAGAKKDFNSVVGSLKEDGDDFVYVTHVECGRLNVMSRSAKVRVDYTNVKSSLIQPMHDFVVDGQSTPLWDSVHVAIKTLKESGLPYDTYLVMVITDGQENSSTLTTVWELKRQIQELQNTDHWTFVFRVPVGHRAALANLGVPAGNIIEWEQTEQALYASTVQTVDATRTYISDVRSGRTSSDKFYTSQLEALRPADLRAELDDITDKVRVETVWQDDEGMMIRDFCMKSFGEFQIGHAYYQLDKTEKVQPQKKIIIKHKKKGKYYSGNHVRSTLCLPTYGEIKLVPGDHPEYEVYVQSTSVNRKLTKKTKVVYIG